MQAAPDGTGAQQLRAVASAAVLAGGVRRRRAGRPGRVVGASLAGWLRRKGGPAGWQRGWCVLVGEQLTWFDDKGGARQFTLELAGCVCQRSQAPMASANAELELVSPGRTYRLEAESIEDAERWLVALCKATDAAASAAAAAAAAAGSGGGGARGCARGCDDDDEHRRIERFGSELAANTDGSQTGAPASTPRERQRPEQHVEPSGSSPFVARLDGSPRRPSDIRAGRADHHHRHDAAGAAGAGGGATAAAATADSADRAGGSGATVSADADDDDNHHPTSTPSDETQTLLDASDGAQLLQRARQLVERTQQANQEEVVLDERPGVVVVVVDEVPLRNRPSHRGSVVVGRAFRGDRLHVQATDSNWMCFDNNSWAEISNGTQVCLVPGSELRDFLQRQPDALRPRQATTINLKPGRLEGWMLKKGEVRHSWKCRYFVLNTGRSGSKLRYYEEGAADEVPRKHLGTIDFADCYSVSSKGDGAIELTVNAVSVHNKHQARKNAGSQQEITARQFEVVPVLSKVAHVSSGRPCLDPDEERLELAERWLKAFSAALGDRAPGA